MNTEITVEVSAACVKLKMNGLPHLTLRRRDIVAFHSWIADKDRYCVEFTFKKGATVLTEYDTKEHWMEVLKKLYASDAIAFF